MGDGKAQWQRQQHIGNSQTGLYQEQGTYSSAPNLLSELAAAEQGQRQNSPAKNIPDQSFPRPLRRMACRGFLFCRLCFFFNPFPVQIISILNAHLIFRVTVPVLLGYAGEIGSTRFVQGKDLPIRTDISTDAGTST